jgi:hypothetical protein
VASFPELPTVNSVFALDNIPTFWYSPERLERIPTPELGAHTQSSSAFIQVVDARKVQKEELQVDFWPTFCDLALPSIERVPSHQYMRSDSPAHLLPTSLTVSFASSYTLHDTHIEWYQEHHDMSDEASSPVHELVPVASTNKNNVTKDTSGIETMTSVNDSSDIRVHGEREDREKSSDSIIALDHDRDHDRSSPDIPLRRDSDREQNRGHRTPEEAPLHDHRNFSQQPIRQQPVRRVQQSLRRPTPNHQPMQSQYSIPRPNLQTTPSTSHRKKPGPKPWSMKPLTKNDLEAKKELIAEIERYWGKSFIKTFIPKCHRPLVKKGKHGKRSSFRQSENDPKKWMPSVLKAILMIAKKTDDKQWLKEQMRDVVTYRIKHTGNRKPQLVTTDFDVIEDVFDSGWTVAQSFAIRYKHLLMNRTGTEEKDEDIAHIFGEGPRGEGSEDSEEDSEDGGDGDDDDDDDDDADQYGEDRSQKEEERSLSTGYFQSSGYVQPPQYPLPAKPKQGYGQPHPGLGQQAPPRQQPRNNECSAYQDTWAPPPLPHSVRRPRSTPMQQRPTLSPSYTASEGRRPHAPGSKRQRSPEPYEFGQAMRNRSNNMITSATPTRQLSRKHAHSSTPIPQYHLKHLGIPKIKTEPGLEDRFGFEEYDGPGNDLRVSEVDRHLMDNEPDDHEILRLEMEAAEAKVRAANAKLRWAESNKRKAM